MERPHRHEEFEIVVDENGSFSIPAGVVRRLQRGKHYIVRMSEGKLHASLRRRGITEDEIETIAGLQLEPRENVLRFLQSEGAFARNASMLRAMRNWKRRQS